MPTINRVFAEREIACLKKQKQPKVYCVVRYQNRLNGDSEKMTYSGYKICYRPDQYEALMRSNFVGGVDVLWASERFKQTQLDENDAAEDWLTSAEGIRAIRKFVNQANRKNRGAK